MFIINKLIRQMCVFLLLRSQAIFLTISLSLGFSIAWGITLLELGHLIVLQWSLSVWMQGQVACLILNKKARSDYV